MVKMLTRSRIEYVDWGINWIQGCISGCAYCYMESMQRRFNSSVEWCAPRARFDDPVAALRKRLQVTEPTGTLMLSTSHDPAMTVEIARQMAGLVDVLGEWGLVESTLVLTKHPAKALGALRRSPGHSMAPRFGISLTSLSASKYECGAEPAVLRIAALLAAHEAGYPTWVSIEPPLPGVTLAELVREVISWERVMPWVVLGKMNYRGDDPVLKAWASDWHWAVDRDVAVTLLQRAGYSESLTPTPCDGFYYIKRELEKVAYVD